MLIKNWLSSGRSLAKSDMKQTQIQLKQKKMIYCSYFDFSSPISTLLDLKNINNIII